MFGDKTLKNQLEPPPMASRPGAVEVLRVWAVSGEGQQFSLQPIWKDPGAWGLLFVDLARYLAQVYEKEGMNGEEVLLRIREMYDAEWGKPTDDPEDVPTR